MKNLLQRFGLLLGLAAAAIVLRPFWEKQITNLLVNNVLTLVQSAWPNDVVFVAVLLVAIGVFAKQLSRKYIPSGRVSVWALLLLCFYGYYRTDGSVWTFQHFTFNEKLKYTDALACVLGLQVLLWGLSYIQKKGDSSQVPNVAPILDDLPLEENEDDNLGYSTYAQQIAQKIQVTIADKRAIAIGVHGQWGSGKTSFIRLLKNELDKTDCIQLSFNAWNSQTPQAIIQDFFQTLQAEMSQYHAQTASLLTHYANQLVKLNDNTTTQVLQTISATLTGFESTQQLHDNINDSIARIGRKIVIYIDDLDRLDKVEIVEVLRLIRNTANFKNTFFVVAYDREYVINALEKSDFHGAPQYLEKIFQLEINLPAYEKKILANNLFQKLDEEFKHEDSDKVEMLKNEIQILNQSKEFKEQIIKHLNSMRDVTRLANGILLNISKVYGDVNLHEFILLEILRMKNVSLYQDLYFNTALYLDEPKKNSSYSYYVIIDGYEKYKEKIGYDIIAEMFPKKNRFPSTQNSQSIVYPNKFRRYFSYTIQNGESMLEIKRARALDESDFLSKITYLLDRFGFLSYITLLEYFESHYRCNDFADFKKMVKGIILVAYKNNNPLGYRSWEYENLDTIIYYYVGKNKDKITEIRQFLCEILKKNDDFGVIESRFISSKIIQGYNNRSDYSLIFPEKEELFEIILTHLKKYLEVAEPEQDNHIIASLFFSYFDANILKEESYLQPLKQVMQDYIIEKNLDNFILSSVWKHRKESDTIFYIYKNYGYYDVMDDTILIEKVFTQKNSEKWKYIEEFERFYNQVKANNFAPISFPFNIIPIDEIKENPPTYI